MLEDLVNFVVLVVVIVITREVWCSCVIVHIVAFGCHSAIAVVDSNCVLFRHTSDTFARYVPLTTKGYLLKQVEEESHVGPANQDSLGE